MNFYGSQTTQKAEVNGRPIMGGVIFFLKALRKTAGNSVLRGRNIYLGDASRSYIWRISCH